MPLIAPEVVVESILNTGFADIVANASTYVPFIFQQFPTAYQNEAIDFLTNNFKIQVNFNYFYDPALIPAFNIVLSTEGEAQEFLNDGVEYADEIPNTLANEQFGSDWQVTVNIVIRAEKARQAIVLYNLTKWLMLKNRQTFEQNFIKATVFSGSDLGYEVEKSPTFVFARTLKIVCRVLNTVDINIQNDPIINSVFSKLDVNTRILSGVQTATS